MGWQSLGVGHLFPEGDAVTHELDPVSLLIWWTVVSFISAALIAQWLSP